jgi:hypothetical protein
MSSLNANLNDDREKVDIAKNKFVEFHRLCIDKTKKSGSPLTYDQCMADSVPNRCKALVWLENHNTPMQLCIASCVGKNTAFGDCSN